MVWSPSLSPASGKHVSPSCFQEFRCLSYAHWRNHIIYVSGPGLFQFALYFPMSDRISMFLLLMNITPLWICTLSFVCRWTPSLTLCLPADNNATRIWKYRSLFNTISDLWGLFPAVEFLNYIVIFKNTNTRKQNPPYYFSYYPTLFYIPRAV